MENRSLINLRSKTLHTARNVNRARNLRGLQARISRIAGLFLAALMLSSIAIAEPDAERTNRVKAAFILNIARFVTWPSEALDQQSDHLLLCLYRSNPFGEAIASIEGESVSGRRLQAASIQNMAKSASCNILLIADDEIKSYAEDKQPDAKRPLLVIVDRTDEDALQEPLNAAIVTLVRNGSRIGFEINLERSRQAGLKMSSKLLKLASIVDGS